MIRLFSILTVISAVALTVWFVIQNDGQIVIEWLDYYIEISFFFAVMIIFFCLVLFTIFYNILSYLKRLPNEMTEKYHEKRNKQSLYTLIEGFGALALEDFDRAKSLNRKILSNIDDKQFRSMKPMATLLASGVSEAIGDEVSAEENYKSMLGNKNLHFVGLKKLFFLKHKQGKYSEALIYGEEAFDINHKIEPIKLLLLDIYKKLNMWEKAQKILKTFDNKFYKTGILDINQEYKEIYIKYAEDLKNQNLIPDATNTLEKLHKRLPQDKEVAILLAKLYIETNQLKSAQNTIKHIWKYSQNKELAILYANSFKSETALKKITKLKDLIDSSPESYEGYIVLAEIMINENMLDKAQEVMEKLLEKHPVNSDIAIIMSKIETKSSAKPSEIYKWLEKI
jgi:uncharacterized membrane-anchored protein